MKHIQLVVFILLVAMLPAACNKVPKNPLEEEQKKVLRNKGRLVGNLADAANMHQARIQGVALVRGLADTGANEPPSLYQQMVLKDLQRDEEKKGKAKEEIAAMSTAIVLLQAVVPPGARKGDRLDVEVMLPPGSEATSIQGGYVDRATMHQWSQDLQHMGDRLAMCGGYIVLDNSLVEKKDDKAYKKGRIIGGALVTKSRPVWLVIREAERTASVAQRIEDVVNRRFNYLRNGSKCKVAEAKAGAVRVNLIVPDEYRDNIRRYMRVVRDISFFETPDEMESRLTSLKVKLLDPDTSEGASRQLEAIGPNNPRVVEALEEALADNNDMVRFNSAIAIAYMNVAKDRDRAAETLADFARTRPRLRPAALAVLGTTMKNSAKADTLLRAMLASDNNEIRYGAFRALWTRNPKDYMILGENMGNRFDFHCLNCGGPPLVHMTASKRPEIVLFAKDRIFLQGNFNLDAGNRISVRSEGSEVVVKKYKSGIDEQRIVSYRLDEIVRAIAEVGGSYADVVAFLNSAKSHQNIVAGIGSTIGKCELAVDALPGGKPDELSNDHSIEKLAMAEIETDEKAKKDAKASGKSFMNPKTWFASDKPKNNPEEDVKANEFSDD